LFGGATEPIPPSPIGERAKRSEEVAAAETALGVLAELAETQAARPWQSGEVGARLLFDPRLMTAKYTLRPYPPVRVRCAHEHLLDWIALAPFDDHGLQLVHGQKLRHQSLRQGGALDIMSSTLGGRAALGTVTWVEDANAGLSAAIPVPSGDYGDVFGLKGIYRCKKCGREFPTLHVSLLRTWLNAVIRADREIILGAPTRGARRSYAERIADRGSARAWSSRKYK
jgi:hypothetical protein